MKTGNHSDNSQYRLYKDKLNHITRKSKSNNYKNYLAKYKPNIKKTWSGIKELIGSSGKKNGIPLCLNINGEITSDPKCIAEKFNKFFVNVAPKLVSKQKPGKTKFHEQPNTQKTFMSPVTILLRLIVYLQILI